MKLPISLMAAAATLAGYLLRTPRIDPQALAATVGVFLLAGGAGALNHYQDRVFDSRFRRTRHRPLPSGVLTAGSALVLAAATLLAALAVLACLPTLRPLGVGLLALVLYNIVYTPLKKRSLTALLPGAVCGMLPPLIGWLAAGGRLMAPDIWLPMTALGLWQIPHFWLLLLSGETDPVAGPFAHPLEKLPHARSQGILFVWILAFVCVVLLLPATGVLAARWSGWTLSAYALFLIALAAVDLLGGRCRRKAARLYRALTVAMGLTIGLLIVDRLTAAGGL